ncbi:MAG: transglycosylase SLT domain-containing protein [Candidatus Sericytochromatia bacterium]
MFKRSILLGVCLAATLPMVAGMGQPPTPLAQGQLAYQQGDYDQAHALLEEAPPGDGEAQLWKGNAAYRVGQADEAIAAWQVAAADPAVGREAETAMNQAREHLKALTTLLDRYSALQIGEATSGDWKRLAADLEALAKRAEGSLSGRRAALVAADCIGRAGDPASAIARFEEAKDDHALVADWALWRMAELNPASGQSYLATLVDRFPDSPFLTAAKVTLAEAEPDVARREQALLAVVKEGDQNPAAEKALYLLGMLPVNHRARYLVQYWNRYPEGCHLDAVVKDLSKMPGLSADTHYRIASFFYFKSDYGPATTFFNKVRSPMAMYRMGRSFWGLNELDKAVATLNTVVSMDRSLAGKAYLTIGQVEAQRGRWPQAIAAYSAATKYGGEAGVTSTWKLSRIYREQGKTALANQFERSIITHHPWSEEATSILWQEFWGAYEARRYQDALVNGRRLAKHHPHHYTGQAAQYWLGRIHEKLGQKQEAISTYRTLHGRSPAGYYGWRARWRELELSGRGRDPWFSTLPSRTVEEPPIRWYDLLGGEERKLMAGSAGTALPKEMLDWPESVRELLFLRQYDVADRFAAESKSPNLKAWMSFLQLRYRQSIREEKGEPRLAYPLGFAPLLLGSAQRHGIDPLLLAALVREESRFDPTARSWVGATGLAQLMPTTADWVFKQVPDVKGRPLTDPHTNLQLGGWYLSHTHQVFDGNSMFAVAAYNGGPGAVSKWKRTFGGAPDEFVEKIPYQETRHYVMKVFSSYWNYCKLYSGS